MGYEKRCYKILIHGLAPSQYDLFSSNFTFIISGQSMFAFGSHVFSSGPNPFQDIRYSVFPFLMRLSRILSTTNSSPSDMIEWFCGSYDLMFLSHCCLLANPIGLSH